MAILDEPISEFEIMRQMCKEFKLSPWVMVEHPELPWQVKLVLAIIQKVSE